MPQCTQGTSAGVRARSPEAPIWRWRAPPSADAAEGGWRFLRNMGAFLRSLRPLKLGKPVDHIVLVGAGILITIVVTQPRHRERKVFLVPSFRNDVEKL